MGHGVAGFIMEHRMVYCMGHRVGTKVGVSYGSQPHRLGFIFVTG